MLLSSEAQLAVLAVALGVKTLLYYLPIPALSPVLVLANPVKHPSLLQCVVGGKATGLEVTS